MQTPFSSLRSKLFIALVVLLVSSAFLFVWFTKPALEVNSVDAKSLPTQPSGVAYSSPRSSAQAQAEKSIPQETKVADTTVSAIPLAGCEAVMEAANEKGESKKLIGSDGLFDRLFIAEKKPLQFTLTLPNLTVGEPVFITAPNGGNLSRKEGPLSYKAQSQRETITLNFEPSIGRGAYTIRIQHRGESQIIDLWAGARNPLGKPGPAYVN